MTGTVHSQRGDGIVHLTLDNAARRNALSKPMLAELKTALVDAASDGCRAALIRGAGDVFSAGADLVDLDGTAADLAFDDAVEAAVRAIHAFPGAVIAAVDGPCMGAALDLASACDLIVASERAVFEVPAVRLGLLYNPGAVARMRRRLPAATLSRLLLLGERLSAGEALAGGLVSLVVPSGELGARAESLARRVARAAPRALAATKGLLLALARGERELGPWNDLRAEIVASPERRAALRKAKADLGLAP